MISVTLLVMLATVPVVCLAAWLGFLIMREAAAVHSFNGFNGIHFEE